ncbi:Uncharacterized protein APZ42_002953 [Daphnia magna]|uniref:Uncharacterized protein n=1 Tax=Daphnia magna TaxID=35525 RepID=A0A164HXP0_9CRUS|nr:Uncharacterized protein APZ42_002953 [Daphnia magna]
MERKPLCNITNYKQHCRSAIKPKKHKEIPDIVEKPDELLSIQTIPLQLEDYNGGIPNDESH